jgi:heptosyltransferase I
MRSFATILGVPPSTPRWDIPLSSDDIAAADEYVDPERLTLCINPVSSHKSRNWNIGGYAQVADHAIRRHGMQVIITGGRGDFEIEFNNAVVAAMQETALNLTGRDTLLQLAAMLERCDLLMSPDTGPMHIATAMGADVLGLHAATNPRRSGPYLSLQWCVNQYDAAARKYLNCDENELKWGTNIRESGVMDLISVDQVVEKLDAWIEKRSHRQSK